MKLLEYTLNSKELDKYTPNVEELSQKHNVTANSLVKELVRGISVELEHTSNIERAAEIALDHLRELPDYYSRLRTIDPH